jgi:hypothetical protein
MPTRLVAAFTQRAPACNRSLDVGDNFRLTFHARDCRMCATKASDAGPSSWQIRACAPAAAYATISSTISVGRIRASRPRPLSHIDHQWFLYACRQTQTGAQRTFLVHGEEDTERVRGKACQHWR